MKRIAILLATVAVFASTATIALADDDIEAEPEATEARELNDTQLAKAELLAKFLLYDYSEDGAPVYGDEPTEEELLLAEVELLLATEAIVELRTGETVVGWGAIFKLLQLVKAGNTTLEDLLADIGDEGWGFGKRFKEYREELRENADGAPKNFGQLKKQEREANRADAP